MTLARHYCANALDTQVVVDYLSGAISDGYCNYWMRKSLSTRIGWKRVSNESDWSTRYYGMQKQPNDNRSEIQRHLEEKTWCYTHEIPFLGGELTIVELDDYNHNPKPLNMETIVEGCRTMAINSPYHFKDLVNEKRDAITSDVCFNTAFSAK